MNLHHQVINNTKEEAKVLAMKIAEHDGDFNGDNGEEYLWEKAKGFESNAAYAWSEAEKEPTPAKMLGKFFAIWLSDDSYYTYCDWSFIQDNNKLSVALVWNT